MKNLIIADLGFLFLYTLAITDLAIVDNYAWSLQICYCEVLLYRIKRKSIWGLKIFVVIEKFFLLADALLRGSSVVLSR